MSVSNDLVMPFVHPNLKQLSNSSDELLHTCPRRYELYKLLDRTDESDVHTDFGSIVGEATQKYIVTRSRQQAYLTAFAGWKKFLDDDAGEKQKKTFWYTLHAIDTFAEFFETEFHGFEVARFGEDKQPACELGFTIDCGDGYVYRGFLDSLLLHTQTGTLAVYEGKTTGSTANEAVYKNRGQGLGYSLIVDAISTRAGYTLSNTFAVNYAVYQSKLMEWVKYGFIKSHTDRANWIRQILLTVKHIQEYAEEQYFPQWGTGCYTYFRECPYYGNCHMNNKILVGNVEKVSVKQDDMNKYQFHFSIDEIIEAQIRKMEATALGS